MQVPRTTCVCRSSRRRPASPLSVDPLSHHHQQQHQQHHPQPQQPQQAKSPSATEESPPVHHASPSRPATLRHRRLPAGHLADLHISPESKAASHIKKEEPRPNQQQLQELQQQQQQQLKQQLQQLLPPQQQQLQQQPQMQQPLLAGAPVNWTTEQQVDATTRSRPQSADSGGSATYNLPPWDQNLFGVATPLTATPSEQQQFLPDERRTPEALIAAAEYPAAVAPPSVSPLAAYMPIFAHALIPGASGVAGDGTLSPDRVLFLADTALSPLEMERSAMEDCRPVGAVPDVGTEGGADGQGQAAVDAQGPSYKLEERRSSSSLSGQSQSDPFPLRPEPSPLLLLSSSSLTPSAAALVINNPSVPSPDDLSLE
eukprot:m.96230 g.96230  ORF g.96230 m.96230 type:complete len:372 (+) comp15482_c1_seq1:342-1457(+)